MSAKRKSLDLDSESGVKRANNTKYGALPETHSTIAIEDLALIHRTNDLYKFAWAKKGDLTSLLSRAKTIIRDKPHSTTGYLFAGVLWLVEGNVKQARTVLDEGLRSTPATAAYYALLQRYKRLAVERINMRVDFIAGCPPEICSVIIWYLDIGALYQSIGASRTWRGKILQDPYRWRLLKVDRNVIRGSIQRSNTGSILPLVAHHTEHLTLYGRLPGMNDVFLELIASGKFQSIKYLDIADTIEGGETKSNFMDLVYRALPQMAETLSELSISTAGRPGIYLGQVLSLLPNLVSLHSAVQPIMQEEILSTTKLTKLDLYVEDTSMTTKILKPLFRCSPRLRIVNLTNCASDALQALENSCPNLTVLSAESELFDSSIMDEGDLDSSNEDILKPQGGLKTITLSGVDSAIPLLSRIDQDRDKLEQMHLYTRPGDAVSDWEPLSRFSLPKLHTLAVYVNGSSIISNIPAMLRSYPNLTTLTLESYSDGSTEEIFRAVAGMHKLSSIRLSCFNIRGPYLAQLLETYAEMHERSPLQELVLKYCPGLTVDVMKAASRIRSLGQLTLYEVSTDVSISNIDECTRLIAELPSLVYLEVGELTISDESAENIVASKSLNTVCFGENVRATPEAETRLRDCMENFYRADL